MREFSSNDPISWILACWIQSTTELKATSNRWQYGLPLATFNSCILTIAQSKCAEGTPSLQNGRTRPSAPISPVQGPSRTVLLRGYIDAMTAQSQQDGRKTRHYQTIVLNSDCEAKSARSQCEVLTRMPSRAVAERNNQETSYVAMSSNIRNNQSRAHQHTITSNSRDLHSSNTPFSSPDDTSMSWSSDIQTTANPLEDHPSAPGLETAF
jgi:hypothetical protein